MQNTKIIKMFKNLLTMVVLVIYNFNFITTAPHDVEIYCTETNPSYTKKEITLNNADELHQTYWLDLAKTHVHNAKGFKPNMAKAKNVILFLGDGMSVQTTTVSRINKTGESGMLSFQNFRHTGLSKTYCADKTVPDSACTATAYLSGIKANYGTIGVNAHVKRHNCEAQQNRANHVYSIAKWAMDAGKSAGFVTTTSVTDASPAGVYANVANRDWENDQEVKKECPNDDISDIAKQLVYGDVGQKLRVIMGGGRTQFLDSTLLDESGASGKRTDGSNLIDEWKSRTNGTYIWNREQLLNLNVDDSLEYLMGLFSESHLPYYLEAIDKNIDVPRLHEMTTKAIEVLNRNPNGYFLFVEGGLIDKAHHKNQARMAVNETLEFDEAISRTLSMVDSDDTLIVVTSDHGHTMTVAGYLERGADIYDVAGLADDGMTYFSLSYGNGISLDTHFQNGHRVDPLKIPDRDKYYFTYPGIVPLDKETHGGGDVVVYASGPYSHLFTGVYEEHVIPHMMAYAACIGDGLTHCDKEH